MELKAALASARKNAKNATRIVSASFDLKRGAIVVNLSTGGTLIVPRSALPGFDTARPELLRDLKVQSSGLSVWSDAADLGARIETLLEAVAGTTLTSMAARRLAEQTSPAKAAAARRNGRKGGRPRKDAA